VQEEMACVQGISEKDARRVTSLMSAIVTAPSIAATAKIIGAARSSSFCANKH
jgi:hypothetical protein